MFFIECVAAALIAIALGVLVNEDTRDKRIRVTREKLDEAINLRF
jgi:hypothetical protein